MSARLTSAPSGSLPPPPAAAAPLLPGLAVEPLHAASSSIAPRVRAADLRSFIPCLLTCRSRPTRVPSSATDQPWHPSSGRDQSIDQRGPHHPVARPCHLLSPDLHEA